MAKEIIALKDFEPKGSHHFLLDTNMWIYLFSPIGSTQLKLQESAGRFIEHCNNVHAEIVTTSFIIAEFFHVSLGLSFDQWKIEQKSSAKFQLKKDYRPTKHYADSINVIQSSIDSILKISNRKDDKFETISINNILSNSIHAEYFDNYTLEMSNENGWFIVTNDKDLHHHPNRQVPILSI